MIEETGVVVAVEGDKAWIETQVKSTCGSCKASEACPTSTVAKAFSPKPEHVLIDVPCHLTVGQSVKIGISETALLYASMMVYILPLFSMIVFASLVSYFFQNIHELIVLTLSCFVALGAYWWVSANAKKPQNMKKYKPVFLGATKGAVMTQKHEIPTHKFTD